jgi:hypothetical protein
MLRWTWGISLVALCGCQLVLGFEDHEPFSTGGGGTGGANASSTATQNTTGTMATTGMGGEGGQPVVITFGEALELTGGGGALTDIAVDQGKIYALRPSADRIVECDEASMTLTDLTSVSLLELRGLTFAGGLLYTSAVDDPPTNCAVYQVDPISGAPTVLITQMSGANCYVAVAAEGSQSVTSLGAEVRKPDGGAGIGTLIGKAYSGSNIPAVAMDGGDYFWVDAIQGEILRTSGATVLPQHNPPGNQVDTVADVADPIDLAIRNGQIYVIGEPGVGRVATTANNGALTILTPSAENPRGISVDATHVYWADGPSVRAVPIDAQGVQPTIIYDGPETPNDTFSRGDAIFFTTQSGKIFRITKTIQ